jgi:hypothetical protein
MTIDTVSITGDSVLWIIKKLGLKLPEDAVCQFVRVDQNTREIFLDYATDRPDFINELIEGSWRWTNASFRLPDMMRGAAQFQAKAIAAQRKPCLRPPGCADNWWNGAVK